MGACASSHNGAIAPACDPSSDDELFCGGALVKSSSPVDDYAGVVDNGYPKSSPSTTMTVDTLSSERNELSIQIMRELSTHQTRYSNNAFSATSPSHDNRSSDNRSSGGGGGGGGGLRSPPHPHSLENKRYSFFFQSVPSHSPTHDSDRYHRGESEDQLDAQSPLPPRMRQFRFSRAVTTRKVSKEMVSAREAFEGMLKTRERARQATVATGNNDGGGGGGAAEALPSKLHFGRLLGTGNSAEVYEVSVHFYLRVSLCVSLLCMCA
jgi:hypothetical protein